MRPKNLINYMLFCLLVSSSIADKKEQKVFGEWNPIDYVRNPSSFNPAQRFWRGDLHLEEFEFKRKGKTHSSLFSWNEEAVIFKDYPAEGKYWVETIHDDDFLFLEWITTDVVHNGKKPGYYVFARSKWERPKKIFKNDPIAVGQWISVDFVSNISDFKSNSKQWKGNLRFKGIDLNPDGSSNIPTHCWTKGIIRNGTPIDSKYTIKKFNGEYYMFYEWISGDVLERGKKPKYYVLKKNA